MKRTVLVALIAPLILWGSALRAQETGAPAAPPREKPAKPVVKEAKKAKKPTAAPVLREGVPATDAPQDVALPAKKQDAAAPAVKKGARPAPPKEGAVPPPVKKAPVVREGAAPPAPEGEAPPPKIHVVPRPAGKPDAAAPVEEPAAPAEVEGDQEGGQPADMKELTTFHETIHPLVHDALPEGDYAAIRARLDVLLKQAHVLAEAELPPERAGKKEEFRALTGRLIREVEEMQALREESQNEELRKKFDQMHETFEQIMGLVYQGE
ncbi:MAG: hypothetical protein WB626_03705 [Bacteroidota bacterium]